MWNKNLKDVYQQYNLENETTWLEFEEISLSSIGWNVPEESDSNATLLRWSLEAKGVRKSYQKELMELEEVSCEMSLRPSLLYRSTDRSWNWLPDNFVCLLCLLSLWEFHTCI